MHIAELLIIAIGVSMDAFAVSICKGLSVQKVQFKHAALTGLWFGGFQALMPLIGYFLGVGFADFVASVDHWIAFILLGIIGGNMIKESCSKDGDHCSVADFSARTMFGLAVATSIDALAIGVSFAFLKVNIWEAVILIGITTALFSGAGIFIGNVFGSRYKSKAEFAGGFILIAMGLKILLEHTMMTTGA
ncbi:MAG: manganese efflux pump [Bacteroidales bacterium]|nr:manganese efflux pump [Bacteroidales bacterium]MBQ9722896.1 manganese efflux pump [Bacteroidales bacterium]